MAPASRRDRASLSDQIALPRRIVSSSSRQCGCWNAWGPSLPTDRLAARDVRGRGLLRPIKRRCVFACSRRTCFRRARSWDFSRLPHPEPGPPQMITTVHRAYRSQRSAAPALHDAVDRAHSRRKDFAFRDFLDLFHHRIVSLFYRAWEKYPFPVRLRARCATRRARPRRPVHARRVLSARLGHRRPAPTYGVRRRGIALLRRALRTLSAVRNLPGNHAGRLLSGCLFG